MLVSNINYGQLKLNFREAAVAPGKHAQFTPYYYVYDGIFAGCRGSEGENQFYNLCTNNGRYCSTDSDDDLDRGISGADVVTESLRRICIWKLYGDDGVSLPWWNNVQEFNYRCDSNDSKFLQMKSVSKMPCNDQESVTAKCEKCMDDSGGVNEDVQKTILEKELSARETTGVLILPSFYVNQAPIRGALTVGGSFNSICAGFVAVSEPEVCQHCSKCADINSCIEVGHCPGSGATNAVSMPVFAASSERS